MKDVKNLLLPTRVPGKWTAPCSREHSCVCYLGGTQHTKEGQEGWGGIESVHAGWWHRTMADPRNSLQDPEMAISCKMALRLSSGLCTVLLLCAVWSGFTWELLLLFLVSQGNEHDGTTLCVYLCTCTLLSFKLFDLFQPNLAETGGLKTHCERNWLGRRQKSYLYLQWRHKCSSY